MTAPREGISQSPVVVALPSGVHATAIAAGQGIGYAIGSDGNLYSWGDSPYGALGNGTTMSDTPVEVSLPSGVTPKAIACRVRDRLRHRLGRPPLRLG